MKNEIYIICSSHYLRNWLDNARGWVSGPEWEFYLDSKDCVWVENYPQELNCNLKSNTRRLSIKSESIGKFLSFLDRLEDQPITIRLTDDWGGSICIKDAVL